MRHLRLLKLFAETSAQNELAYRANFWISVLHAVLNLATGVLGLVVIFNQVETLRGWDLPATLALLGVYLTVGALRGLFISPSLESLAGMDGEVWTGQMDFTLLRPLSVQFHASFRHWRPLALLDLALGLGVLVFAMVQLGEALSLGSLLLFLLTLAAGMVVLYAILLFFSGLVFWSPGFLFTWVFNGLFQMARYPVGLYPGWVRLVLTWVIPVGIITTVPAQALTGTLGGGMLAAALGLALVLFTASSRFFNFALKKYVSASS